MGKKIQKHIPLFKSVLLFFFNLGQYYTAKGIDHNVHAMKSFACVYFSEIKIQIAALISQFVTVTITVIIIFRKTLFSPLGT